MKFQVLISTAAKLDILESCQWYEAQSNGLGDKFENELSKAIKELTYHPVKFQIKYRNVESTPITTIKSNYTLLVG